MASESDIIQVDITVSQAGTPRDGYGMPLIPSHNAPWLDRVRLYSDSSDAVTDGYASDSPEVLALAAIFSQTPKPPLVAVGRMTAEVTQRYELAAVAKNSFAYQLQVEGEGFEGALVQYMSDAAAAVAEVHAGLLAALNAVSDKTFTAAYTPLVLADDTFTVDAGTDVATFTTLDPATGAGPIQLTSADTLPAGLALATDYWWIRTGAKTGKFATSLANALAGTAVDITDAGTGVHTASDTANTIDPSLPLVITGDAPGNWFSLQVLDRTALSIKQTHTVAGLTDDLDAILNVSKAWYCVVPLYCSADYVGDIAAWTASHGRITVFDTCDTDVLAAYISGTSTDVGATLLGLGYSGVCGMFASAPVKFAAAAWMGRWLPTLPGQTNPAFRFLEGVVAEDLTDTELANLVARRMNVYRAAFATAITWEGTVFSPVYRYLDVRRNVDWLRDEMIKGTFDIQVGSEGLGFDDPGIQALAGGPKQALRLAEERGVVNPGWKVEVPTAASIPSADKAQRKLSKLKASGSVRGFVNKVNPIQLTISF